MGLVHNYKGELTETEARLLDKISVNPNMTQRDLSTSLDISLGMVNIFLKKLIAKSLIKIKKINKRNLQYLLTIEGVKESTKCNLRHLENNLNHYIEVKKKITELLQRIKKDGHNKVLICASEEWRDIFYLGVKAFNFEVAGFVAERPGNFFELPVYSYEESVKLSEDRFDCILSLTGDNEFVKRIANGKKLYTFY